MMKRRKEFSLRTWNDYRKALGIKDPVFDFASTGNVEGLKSSINVVNLDATDSRGYSPLMLTACHGHYEAAAFLIKLGADLSTRDNNGNSPLMAAVFYGHLPIVKLLLENGADPDACNYKKQTALLFAKIFGKREIAEVLIENRAS